MGSNPVIAELKACPHCGSEQIAVSPCQNITDDAMPEISWAVICKACAARVDRGTEESAIAAWNTRVSTPPPGIEPEAADRGVSEAFRAIEAWVDAKIGFVNVVPAKRQTYIPLLNRKRDAAIAAIQSLRFEPEAADRGVRRFGALATAEDLDAADEATITEAPAGHIALCKEGASWIRDLCAEMALLRESLSMFVDAAKPRRMDGFHEMPLFHARELEIARQSLRSEQEDGR